MPKTSYNPAQTCSKTWFSWWFPSFHRTSHGTWASSFRDLGLLGLGCAKVLTQPGSWEWKDVTKIKTGDWTKGFSQRIGGILLFYISFSHYTDILYGGFLQDTPQMDGLCHGKSRLEMDDLGVKPLMETFPWRRSMDWDNSADAWTASHHSEPSGHLPLHPPGGASRAQGTMGGFLEMGVDLLDHPCSIRKFHDKPNHFLGIPIFREPPDGFECRIWDFSCPQVAGEWTFLFLQRW